MSCGRQPGPTCATDQPWSINDGTLARWWTPIPMPLGASGWPGLRKIEAPLWCPRLVPDVSYLFNSCRAIEQGLAAADFDAAARKLQVDVAAIQAVAEVETAGQAFDDAGRPRILFERHYFHRLTGGRHDREHPRISDASAGGYGKFSAQYGKLEEAYQLDQAAALSSASWGRFQIMGENHLLAGFSSVHHFVDALAQSERQHLLAFVNFVQAHASMRAALKAHDWAGFAKRYNGAHYKANDYDTKMAAAYARLTAPAPAAGGAASGNGLPR